MDIVRSPRRQAPVAALRAAGVAALVLLAIGAVVLLARQHAVQAIDRSTIITDTVRRGTLERSVEAAGIFAPEHVQVVSATQAGTVERVFVKPGTRVQQGAVIAQLENVELDAAVGNAAAALAVSRANLDRAAAQARTDQLTQQAHYSDEGAQMRESALQASSYAQLHAQGLLPDMQYRNAQIEAQKDATDVEIDRSQVQAATAEARAQVAAARAQVEQAQEQLFAAQAQAAALVIRAGAPGVVQSIDVDPGMRVEQGAELARVANDRDLKAVLQVAESQIGAVMPGMRVRLNVEGSTLYGRVARIAPAAQNGTVAVDVQFASGSSSLARSQANLDGTILLSHLSGVLSLARPAGAADNSEIDLFKLVDGGSRAVRVRVRLGAGSADRVQIVSGLSAGDSAVISDMSNYSNLADVRLH